MLMRNYPDIHLTRFASNLGKASQGCIQSESKIDKASQVSIS